MSAVLPDATITTFILNKRNAFFIKDYVAPPNYCIFKEHFRIRTKGTFNCKIVLFHTQSIAGLKLKIILKGGIEKVV